MEILSSCVRCKRIIDVNETKHKCCPTHTSEQGDDVMCYECTATLHPEQVAGQAPVRRNVFDQEKE